MTAKNLGNVKNETSNQEILFQKMGEQWFAFIVDGPTEDPLYVALPMGVTPKDKDFCLVDLLSNGNTTTYVRSDE